MITVASIVKDAGWFLERTVPVWCAFADRIVALDNGSSDNSAEILADHGAEVRDWPEPMQGAEWKARAALFEWVMASDGWALWLDADQILGSDPRPHLKTPAVGFRVFDMWSETEYRDDRWWRGHHKPWWWGLHAPSWQGFTPKWRERGWHSGHVPPNVGGTAHVMPVECSVLHYAYASPDLRAKKAKLYADLDPHLTIGERSHAKTIESFALTKPLPFEPEYRLWM